MNNCFCGVKSETADLTRQNEVNAEVEETQQNITTNFKEGESPKEIKYKQCGRNESSVGTTKGEKNGKESCRKN